MTWRRTIHVSRRRRSTVINTHVFYFQWNENPHAGYVCSLTENQVAADKDQGLEDKAQEEVHPYVADEVAYYLKTIILK